MRRKLYGLIVSALLLVSTIGVTFVPAVSAVNVFPVCNGAAADTSVCQDNAAQAKAGGNPVIKALRVTISIMSFVIGLTAVIMLIIGAISMSTSGGDPQKVANARNTILYALIGVVVAVIAQTIVAFVLNKL